MQSNAAVWKARLISLALAVLAITLALAINRSVSPGQHSVAWHDANPGFAWTLVGVLSAASLICFLTSFEQRNGSLLRLDWFMPMIRRQPTPSRKSPTLAGTTLRRLVPTSWQSDWSRKQRGPLRKFLRKLGPSWLASPLRRLVQGLCLILFCVLFFYTCWPYDAQRRDDRPRFEDWNYVGFDQAQTLFEFSGPASDADTKPIGQHVFLLAQATGPVELQDGGLVGEFVIADVTGDGLQESLYSLTPAGETTSAMMQMITGAANEERYDVHLENPIAWPSHYADNLASKEWIPAETFLMIDPLVSLSTAIAARSWVWSLTCAAAILIVCVLIPRGFCGYLCPLGTTIDLFDWAVTGRTERFRVPADGWWVHIKYYLLAGILVAACFGVLLSGFFSAIPVITRGMLFLFEPLQNGWGRGWHLVPRVGAGQFISIAMFFAVLCLGFLRPRFWCKYVCPSGAVFSLGNLFRATERKVESSCIHCNKCVEVCPFDAIKPDFTTRQTDCTLCQTCGGVCPTHAIKFVERWNRVELKVENDPPTGETAIGRRGFLSLAAGSAAAVVGGTAAALGTKALGTGLDKSLPIVAGNASEKLPFLPVRPPGSVPEKEFLQMCIRCGECFKACPNNVLQPESFQQGLEGLWTPMVNADWAGCESSCNACGQVCPTGAIRALPLEEKRVARMGLAIVNEATCLPFAGKEACDLCVQECDAAGYHAIEYTQVGVEVDDVGQPIEGTGYAAPVVLADKCVGCGLCQTRCHVINVKDRHVLSASAIIVEAGEGKEDRMMTGSYLELRRDRDAANTSAGSITPSDSPPQSPQTSPGGDDPFGVGSSDLESETPDAGNEESPF